MTEYWVSNARHYCKCCNVWMADNKPSRQMHESSARHKLNMDLMSKKMRQDRYYGARDEGELKRQLEAIERQARAALENDRKEIPGLFAPVQPPAPTTRPAHEERARTLQKSDVEPTPEDRGLYCVRGQYYLEGKLNVAALKTGLTCQIFVEDLDEWLDAVIVARNALSVRNTNVDIVTFDVQYIVPSSDEGSAGTSGVEGEMRQEKAVKSDRLRILSNEAGEVLHLDGLSAVEETEKPEEEENEVAAPAPLDDNTGLTGWSTVSVTVVDSQEEARIRRKQERAMEKDSERAKQVQQQQEKHMKSVLTESEPTDVLSELNPYGSNAYRGVTVGEDHIHSGTVSIAPAGVMVGFKKRKLGNGSSSSSASERQTQESVKVETRAYEPPGIVENETKEPVVENEFKKAVSHYPVSITPNQPAQEPAPISAPSRPAVGISLSMKKPGVRVLKPAFGADD